MTVLVIIEIMLTEKMRQGIREAFRGIDRDALCAALGIMNRNVLDQIAGAFKQVSALRARRIERATGGKVPAAVLRPDIFGDDGYEETPGHENGVDRQAAGEESIAESGS